MAALQEEKMKQIGEISNDYIQKLIDIWNRCFGQSMCLDHLGKLHNRIQEFFEELVEETEEKRTLITIEIEGLQQEAENLRRLLMTEVALPRIHDDLPLIYVQSEMDKSLEDLRKCLRLRHEQICELLLEQETLCEELGEPPRPLLADPLPKEQELYDFRAHLNQLKELRDDRLKYLITLRRDIKLFLKDLELTLKSERDDRLLNHRDIRLNKETFAELQRMHQRFGGQVEEMRSSIDCMRSNLETLWEGLDTSLKTRDKVKFYKHYTKSTYNALLAELNRCETLKRQNIKKFVQNIRKEIVEWWDRTLKSDVERKRFSNFNNDCFTEDLLTIHEMELEDVKNYYHNNQQIFELYADRKILWDRMTALEMKATDPARYTNRGGQLLKEEKERKTIATKLPKIEKEITDLVHEYAKREHTPFLVFGENILEMMAGEWEKKRQEREEHTNARKTGQTPLSKSQLTTTRTPMSLRNVSAASIRRTPSAVSSAKSQPLSLASSQKRKLEQQQNKSQVAKRIMYDMDSPGVFARPNIVPNAGFATKKTLFKSPRVIASVTHRKSGRQSGSIKKRRSVKKNGKTKIPTVHIQSLSSEESKDATYTSFQQYIGNGSRSSMIQNDACSSASRARRQAIANNENERLMHQTTTRITRTKSRQNLHDNHGRANSPNSPSASGSRKLTTKNLPIMI